MNAKQKAAAVKAALNKPFAVGDSVMLMSPDWKDDHGPLKITAIADGIATLNGKGVTASQGQHWLNDEKRGNDYQIYMAPLKRLQHSVLHVGAEPFIDSWRSRAQPALFTLETMLHMDGKGHINFDPCVTAANGTIHHFQRGLVWTTAQKRDLIATVYEGGDIGTLVMRQNKDGDYEVIDGKQRLTTLIEFVNDGFFDHHGNSFDGLSDSAQSKFKYRTRTTCLILPHTASSADIISAFLSINDRGTKVSKAHIEKVKAIKV
jgi:hypothetical protein